MLKKEKVRIIFLGLLVVIITMFLDARLFASGAPKSRHDANPKAGAEVLKDIIDPIKDFYLYQDDLIWIRLRESNVREQIRNHGLETFNLIYDKGHRHFTVGTEGKNPVLYDSLNGLNGAAKQSGGSCLLNATDNYFYLSTCGADTKNHIMYSEFSKKLHGNNKYLRLFYYIFEMYEAGWYNVLSENLGNGTVNKSLNVRLNEFLRENYTDEFLKTDFSKTAFYDVNKFKQSLIKFFTDHGLDDLNRGLSQEEYRVYMYELFTNIKSAIGMSGDFDPAIDTPHLTAIFENKDLPDEEIEKFQKAFREKMIKLRIENVENAYMKRIYNLTKKIPNDFSYINNIEKDGGYVTLGYNNDSKYDNSNVINFSIGYEGSDKGILRYGTNLVVGNTTLKNYTETSNSDINYLSLIGYMKLKLKMLDISSGFFTRNFFDGNNLKRDFKTGTGNYSFGYFVGLHKKMEFFGKNYFRIYSTLFGTNNKLNNTKMFGDESFNSSISYKNLYAENAIELSLEYLTIDGVHLSFIPALKYDSYINNKNRTTYILAKDFDRTISIKNDDKPYVSLQNKITFPCDYIFSLGADFTEDNNIFYVNFSKSF